MRCHKQSAAPWFNSNLRSVLPRRFWRRLTVRSDDKAKKPTVEAIAYLRNQLRHQCWPGKDSDKRQRSVIAAFAKAHGYVIVDAYCDGAASGADPIADRRGFNAILDQITGKGVRVMIVESPNRFARDL